MDRKYGDPYHLFLATAGLGSISTVAALFFCMDAIRAATPNQEHQALMTLVIIVLEFAAMIPLGQLAGARFWINPLPVWLTMTGCLMAPIAAWSTGFRPAWPACSLAVLVLTTTGGWAAYALALLLSASDDC